MKTTCACGHPMFTGDAEPQQHEPEESHSPLDLLLSLLVAVNGPGAPQRPAPKATAEARPGRPDADRANERDGAVRTVDVFVIDLS
ncbi:hypothetical protein ACFY4B_27300 [Kitasatospora sp. NPDC001261]|uniref:hypothetical protein n=1 Tax=Kitasatospora sp. NPDC001261 TaxID=3364012 RepID=UPI0036AE1CEF